MKLSKRVTLPLSIIVSVIGAFALITSWEQHRDHILGAVPYLLLLACPLMHLLMHRRHGSRHGEHSPRSGENQDESRKQHEHGGHGCC